MAKKEFEILDEFIRSKSLRHTNQRETILRTFLATERHVSAEELHRIVKREDPSIGYTTVYRTMRLLSESGLCGEIDFGDGTIRFEHRYGHEHHDHLICTRCGTFTEVVQPEIEKMQDALAKKHRFTPESHKLQIFGVCSRCAKKRRGKG